MIKSTICFLFCLFLLGVNAQLTQVVRGSVIDKYSEESIPFAKIYLMGKSDTLKTQTNLEGYFRFNKVKIGRYDAIITMTGYEPMVRQNLEVTSSKEIVLEIKIEEDLQDIEGVEIVAKKKNELNNKMATISARTFSIEESQRYAGTMNDVARMAQNFAGVQGADDSRNDIIIRGNSPTGVLYRMEGIDIPNPNHFARFGTTGGPISMLNNNVLANSDFLTGAFPAEYGNALAGVFDLKMRHGNNEKHEFMGQIGFNGLEAMAEGPLSKKNKSSYLVNFRYSTLEVFKLLGITFGTAALPKYQDGSFKLRFPHKNGVTQVFGIGGLSNINLLAKDLSKEGSIFGFVGSDVYFRSNTGMLGVTHKQRINSNSFFEINAGLQSAYNNVVNDTLDQNLENVFNTYKSNVVNTKQSTVFNYQNKLSTRHMIKTGLINDIYFLSLEDTVYRPELGRYVSLQSYHGTAVLIRPYFSHRFRINENTTLVSGLYAQFLNLGNQYSIEPRLGFVRKMNHNQSLNFGYGLHSQLAPIEVYFRNDILPDGSTETSNENLDFARSHHLIAGYSKRLNHGINVKAEVYGQYLFNVPIDTAQFSMINFGSSFTTITPGNLKNDGEGYNYGIELTVEKYLEKGFYFLFSGSLFESKYKAVDGKWYNSAFNTNHTLNVLGGYELRIGDKNENSKYQSALTFDAKFVWNGGGRYTPILLSESIAEDNQVLDVTRNLQETYKDYLKGNFKIGFKLYGKKTTQAWSVDLQNFTNQKNIFIREFNKYAKQIKTTYQTGFLPVIQYRITF